MSLLALGTVYGRPQCLSNTRKNCMGGKQKQDVTQVDKSKEYSWNSYTSWVLAKKKIHE
jgi:hypothetical protein